MLAKSLMEYILNYLLAKPDNSLLNAKLQKEIKLQFIFFPNQMKLLDTLYSLIAPRSIPLHLSPRVSQPYQTYLFPFKCCLIEREGKENQLNYFVRNRLRKEMFCQSHHWYHLPKWQRSPGPSLSLTCPEWAWEGCKTKKRPAVATFAHVDHGGTSIHIERQSLDWLVSLWSCTLFENKISFLYFIICIFPSSFVPLYTALLPCIMLSQSRLKDPTAVGKRLYLPLPQLWLSMRDLWPAHKTSEFHTALAL